MVAPSFRIGEVVDIYLLLLTFKIIVIIVS